MKVKTLFFTLLTGLSLLASPMIAADKQEMDSIIKKTLATEDERLYIRDLQYKRLEKTESVEGGAIETYFTVYYPQSKERKGIIVETMLSIIETREIPVSELKDYKIDDGSYMCILQRRTAISDGWKDGYPDGNVEFRQDSVLLTTENGKRLYYNHQNHELETGKLKEESQKIYDEGIRMFLKK